MPGNSIDQGPAHLSDPSFSFWSLLGLVKEGEKKKGEIFSEVNKIVFSGTSDNLMKALQYFEGIYSNIGRFVTIPLIYMFPDLVLKELQIKVGGKHDVDL